MCEKERCAHCQRCYCKIGFCFFVYQKKKQTNKHAKFVTVAFRLVTVWTRAVTLLQRGTDVLYLQMIGVNMQSVMQRVGGWVGRGMTIGFRERAM